MTPDDMQRLISQRHPPPTMPEDPCGATTVFWPEVEAIDTECSLPAGHDPPHTDGILEWTDDDTAP